MGETIDGTEYSFTRDEGQSEMDLRYVSAEKTSPSHRFDRSTPLNGEPIVMIGHSMNVVKWVISLARYAKTRATDSIDPDHIVVSAIGMPDNNGGPAFTLSGEFVGMAIHLERSREGYHSPDDPFFSFAVDEPFIRLVPAKSIYHQVQSSSLYLDFLTFNRAGSLR